MSEPELYEPSPCQEIITSWMKFRQALERTGGQAEAEVIEVDFARRRVLGSSYDELLPPEAPAVLFEELRSKLDSLVAWPAEVTGTFLLNPYKSSGSRTGVDSSVRFNSHLVRLGYDFHGPLVTPHLEYTRGRLVYAADIEDPGLRVLPGPGYGDV